MKSKEQDNILIIRLFPEEDIHERLKEACKKHSVITAVVLSGIGQVKHIQLGYFKEKGSYVVDTYHTPHELLSLSGNICHQGDEYLLHLHAVLGNAQKGTIGGHLVAGIVEVTNELVLLKTPIKITRKVEETTGLSGMYIE
ncbi:MAG: DUF296 domain-containing protein [Candidatus Thermoplasmatota archaeon]|nr:DUF296 domain-containing protein [Candidatus Thermoplasmatota archaeon]